MEGWCRVVVEQNEGYYALVPPALMTPRKIAANKNACTTAARALRCNVESCLARKGEAKGNQFDGCSVFILREPRQSV